VTGWTVYVLLSRPSGSTYVGIALDAERRLAQHNGELPGGARSTRAGRPWRIAATYGPFATRGEAQKAEHQVKCLKGRRRLGWNGSAAS
jgi:putative endonuclease